MPIAHHFFWRFSRVLLLAPGLPRTTWRKMQNLGGGILQRPPRPSDLAMQNHSSPSTSPTMSDPDWAKLITFCVHQMLAPSTKTLMERIPRVFSAKTFRKSRRTNGDIGCPDASALECSSQNPKRYQYANGFTWQGLAFVQLHTAIALWWTHCNLWAWRDPYDSGEDCANQS